MIFWGSPVHPGSLCHLREQINRKQVDKAVKVFNVGDEFLLHCFKVGTVVTECTLSHYDFLFTKGTSKGKGMYIAKAYQCRTKHPTRVFTQVAS